MPGAVKSGEKIRLAIEIAGPKNASQREAFKAELNKLLQKHGGRVTEVKLEKK